MSLKNLFFVTVLCACMGMGMINATDGLSDEVKAEGECPAAATPIVAGMWYPQKGDVSDESVRYYRVRCWPGCHVGSSAYGMYPDEPLQEDHPIFPTSTMDMVDAEN